MIEILDKVIYGLGALTFIGLSLIIITLTLFFFTGITMSIIDSFKSFKNKGKFFRGKK